MNAKSLVNRMQPTALNVGLTYSLSCLLFSVLWHWESWRSAPDWFESMRMAVLLAVFFQPFPWWCYRVGKAARSVRCAGHQW